MASPSGRSPANSALSRNTVRKVLKQAEPDRQRPRPGTGSPRCSGRSRRSSTRSSIDDETAPPKQRHTAAQVFRRLRDEHGYRGGYAQVQRYVRKHRRRHQETFIPLGHLPGQRLEADFGHIHVDFPDGRRPRPVPRHRLGLLQRPLRPGPALRAHRGDPRRHGRGLRVLRRASPKEVWWDNPKTVATLILQGRERQLHPRYAALASHYVFDPRFCMPARGNEKPDAEGTVKAVQTPVRHARCPASPISMN